MNEEIMVSICCLVYNHEPYLRKCIEGFLMQKTNFKFEVLIHDDASTDGSQDIIREYEKNYPDIIKPVYQEENQYSKGRRITYEYQFPRVKGKYVAMCEGDDFWKDETKLQQQVDALERNESSFVSGHQVRIVDEMGNDKNGVWTNVEQKTGTISSKNCMKLMIKVEGPWFHTSSFLFRAEGIKEIINSTPEFMSRCMVGDFPLLLYCISKGNTEYINKEMGCYRVGSKSSVMKNKFDDIYIELKKNEIETYQLFNVYTDNLYAEEINAHKTFIESKILFHKGEYVEMLNQKYREYYSWERYIFLKTVALVPILTPIMRQFEKIYAKLKKPRKIK